MKTFVLILLLAISAKSNELGIEFGLSSDSISTVSFNSTSRITSYNTVSQNTSDFGFRYSMLITEILGFDQSLNINSNQLLDTKVGTLRYDPTLSISLADKLRFLVGPSLNYNYSDFWTLSRFGYGYSLALQYTFANKLYVNAGYYTKKYEGNSGIYDQQIKIESTKVGIGFNF